MQIPVCVRTSVCETLSTAVNSFSMLVLPSTLLVPKYTGYKFDPKPLDSTIDSAQRKRELRLEPETVPASEKFPKV
jgi:hypothetical protein